MSQDTSHSDTQHVVALKAGSESALTGLFQQYHKKIYNISRHMGMPHEDAEGIVQDVFLYLWDKRERLNENLSVHALIITIARRLVFKKIREKVNHLAHQDYLSHTGEKAHNETEDLILFAELEDQLEKAVSTLAPIRRQVFELSRMEGLTNEEIAQKLNIARRTVENHLYRALKDVKQYLEGNDSGKAILTLVLLYLCD